MNEKNEIFKKLLPINQLFELYQRLSETIITTIDVKGLSLNALAVNNSIDMLCEVGMISHDKGENKYRRLTEEKLEYAAFVENLYTGLKASYSEAFLFTAHANLLYDELEAKLYIKRNSVSLDLSGLLMLLDNIGKIEIRQNDVYIIDKSLLKNRANVESHITRHKTLESLKRQMETNEMLGVEAELAAVKFETEILKCSGIDKVPERISEFHVNAGYDIVSYMHTDSLNPDKFIEVKSCSDERWIFYISKNELEVAKTKQDNYFLYLYNRKRQQIRVIQNPYFIFYKSEQKGLWAMEPQVYQVKSLEGLL